MEAIEMSPNLARGAVPSVAVVVDALPYIDMGYDEAGVREAVSLLFDFLFKFFLVVVKLLAVTYIFP
jgi:hypothetical protein